MASLFTVLVVKTIAAIYGLLALGVAILYSLSRSDTRKRSTEQERQAFENECETLWSLSQPTNSLHHNFLTLENGLQLHYLSTEPPPSTPNKLIIFLHGFPDTCYLWEQQLRSNLAIKAQLIALDLPGCGGSDSASFYGPNEILNAVAEAIVQLKIRYRRGPSGSGASQRSILVSHDWGGAIAFRLAGETAGLVDEIVVMNSSYPLAAEAQVTTLLRDSRDAIAARNFKQAWSHFQPIYSQLLKSSYIFMFNLRLPLARWMPWLSASLVKLCHEHAHRNNPTTTASTYTRSLAASYGPSPSESTTHTPSGGNYGPTVQHRAKQTPQGDWDERVRIYSEGLALGEWRPSYPCYQAPMWKSRPESARKGAFSYPVHVMFGMQDVALNPKIVLDGVENFMLDSQDGMRKAQVGGEEGVEVSTVGRSSVTKMWGSGHWAMVDEQGARALERLLVRLVGSMA